jgi:uncharacterized membrane protein (DUF373 family)
MNGCEGIDRAVALVGR